MFTYICKKNISHILNEMQTAKQIYEQIKI